MRLIAWNANFNIKRRSLEDDVALLKPLEPDIVVLSETAIPSAVNPTSAIWLSDRAPGLAVIAFNGLTVAPLSINLGAPKWMAGLDVTGRCDFRLLALWPVQDKSQGLTYHQILMAALERYSATLQTCPAIMAGDFNSSSRVLAQRRSHPAFVQAAGSMGLQSVYHTHSGEQHGEETIATYRRGGPRSAMFHIDYCFASTSIMNSARVTILDGDEWHARSDHFPVTLDGDDAALRAS